MSPGLPRVHERWRFSVSVLLPVAICFVVTALASSAFILWSAQGVDQRSLERQNALARHVIATQLARISHDQQSVTIWDDSIVHTRLHLDPDWIDGNLGVWMHDFFGHDEAIILDDRDQPVYAMAAGERIDPGAAAKEFADVEVPLALPAIMAGLRVATVSAVALTTVGSILDYGGLGDLLVDGTRTNFKAQVLATSVLCVLLAITLDLLLVGVQRLLTPWTRAARA